LADDGGSFEGVGWGGGGVPVADWVRRGAGWVRVGSGGGEGGGGGGCG